MKHWILIGLFALSMSCASGSKQDDALNTVLAVVEIAVQRAEAYESLHPGEIPNLVARVEEVRSLMAVVEESRTVDASFFTALRATEPLYRELLVKLDMDPKEIDKTIFAIGTLLDVVEVVHLTTQTAAG